MSLTAARASLVTVVALSCAAVVAAGLGVLASPANADDQPGTATVSSTPNMLLGPVYQDAPNEPDRKLSEDEQWQAAWDAITPQEKAIFKDRFQRMSDEEKQAWTAAFERGKEDTKGLQGVEAKVRYLRKMMS